MQIAIAPEYQERFGQALDRLGVSSNDRILLAVSGGADSLALLLLAAQWGSDRVWAATVDHRLRAEAADEAVYVSDICGGFGIPHVTLTPADKISGNIQSSARAARYALLAEAAERYGCPVTATAHHADDQLETLLMRLVRGSGVDGMAGIRARNGDIIRPLLDFGKSELEDICETAGIEPVGDPSNENADFDRVAMRQWIARSAHPFDRLATNRTALALADASVALDWIANMLAGQRIGENSGNITLDPADLPKEIRRRLLLLALQRVDPEIAPRGGAVERLLTDLSAGKTVTIGNILCQAGNPWRFSPAPSRRTPG